MEAHRCSNSTSTVSPGVAKVSSWHFYQASVLHKKDVQDPAISACCKAVLSSQGLTGVLGAWQASCLLNVGEHRGS